MAFDGFTLNAVVAELKTNLIGGKVQKIYEPNNNEILLSVYANGLQYALNINVSSNLYAMHLTTSKKENPLVAPNFCMLLRKHLMNFRITNISTFGLERIVTIEFAGSDENHEELTKKLVIELMGKYSNILLLNEQGNIIDALKHFSMQDGSSRNILPRFEYLLPTSDKLDIEQYAVLENSFEPNSSLISFFANHFIGVSKILVKQAIFSLGIFDVLNHENYIAVVQYLINLKQSIFLLQAKCILLENNDYTLIPTLEKETLQVNFFLDDYYFQKQTREQFVNYRNQLLNFILAKFKKIAKKLLSVEEKLKECDHMEEYQLYGELITSNLYQISKEHLSHIALMNYYNNETIDVPLDISLSPSENAKKYFKKYHKLKNTCTIVQEQKIELEKEINYLESIVYEIQSATSINELDSIYEEIQDAFMLTQKQKNKNKLAKKKNKKQSKTLEPICYDVQSFKVLVGKSNKHNDELTFKIARKEDIWFHVKDLHGSHVVLVTDGKIPSQEVINECAQIAAFHSKAMQSSNVAVDYTLVKYVKKPSNSNAGMVIYTNQKTVNVQPKNSLC